MAARFKLTQDSSMEKAAETLIRAADLAEKTNDTDAIMNVVAGWLEIHDRFVGAERDKPKNFGFSATFSQQQQVEELEPAVSEGELEEDE